MAGKINRVRLLLTESKQGEELTGFCSMPKFAIVYLDRWGNPRRFPRAFLESWLPTQRGSTMISFGS